MMPKSLDSMPQCSLRLAAGAYLSSSRSACAKVWAPSTRNTLKQKLEIFRERRTFIYLPAHTRWMCNSNLFLKGSSLELDAA